MKTSGGRRGPADARGRIRERIRQCARAEFIDSGYDGATIRAIARRADCDSALVTYYFGSKQKLFRACMDLPDDPAQIILSLLAPGPDGAAERLLNYGFDLYEHHMTSDTLQALMRALVTDAQTSQRFRHYIRSDVLGPVQAFIGADRDFAEQIEAAMAMMYGIAVMRYLVRLEPLASMPRKRLISQVAPILQERIDRIFAHAHRP
ncbi:TetR family transcriptional regulator [Actinomyces sp. B33]|uniref:TetR/AcrR family transcriptional regulator n=1 Tax=Actinomyces sp. B33 TaxID=2942131 RepID=UPI0023413D72|nr:TetR family transcriptional regulator [Actinomyces sp. B33]MDC4233926.1 TetR family transcriptional regulator [Actinomyces sp. B33]